MQWHPITIPLLVAAAISALLTILASRRRYAPGAAPFATMMLGAAVWLLAYTCELLQVAELGKILCNKIQYLGIVSVPVAWLAFALEYTGRREWLTARRVALVALLPLVTLILVFTNGTHHLVWHSWSFYQQGGLTLVDPAYGTWFWVHTGYSYLCLLAGTILIVPTVIRSLSPYRGQALAMLIGVAVPWVGNVIYVFDLLPVGGLDPTPFSFAVSGMVMSWGVFRYRLFDLMPVAQDAVVKGLRDGVIVLDAHDRIAHLNPAAAEILGVPARQVLGRPAAEAISSQPDWTQQLSGEGEWQGQVAFSQDGSPRHYDVRISPFPGWRRSHAGRLVVLHDITDRVRAEEQVLHLKQFTDEIAQSVTRCIIMQDAEGEFTFVNPAAADLLGYTPEELLDLRWTAIVPPDQQHMVQAAEERRRNGVSDRYELALLHKDGTRVPVLIAGSPWLDETTGEFDGTLAVLYDMSGLGEAETQLERHAGEMEALYEESQRRASHREALNAIIASASTAGDQKELLKASLQHTLQALGLEMGVAWADGQMALAGVPDEQGEALEEMASTVGLDIPGPVPIEDLETYPIPSEYQEWANLGMDAGLRALLVAPIMSEGQQPGGICVAGPEPRAWSPEEVALLEAVGRELQTANDRVRLLRRIWDQARQVHQIVDTVPEGIVLLSPDYHIVLANPVAREYLSLLGDAHVGDFLTSLAGRPVDELVAPRTTGAGSHEVEIAGPPSRVFEVRSRAMETDPAEGGWVLVVRDVTEERHAQQRVQQQDQLAALGQLAAGIAHDFNNIIASIVLYSDIMLEDTELSPDHQRRLTTMRLQARRATDLTQQILDFGRRAVMQKQELDLVAFLQEVMTLLERTLPEHIGIQFNSSVERAPVSADPTRLQQAVMNLAINARDAMPEGGDLTFELAPLQLEPGQPPPAELQAEPDSEADAEASGDWVRLAVIDTGGGMPPDVLSHIFEPFFTTKEEGKGTGLGLSQVYGIVKLHGGHIEADSRVGEGATFTIYLPALAPLEPQAKAGEPSTRPRGEGETVLLVEDNPVTRVAMKEGLEWLNYQVLAARGGKEALNLFEQHQDDVALVITDLIMPKMGGFDLCRQLREKRPDLPLVVLTGYPLDDSQEELQAAGVVEQLQKPLNLQELAQVVARILRED